MPSRPCPHLRRGHAHVLAHDRTPHAHVATVVARRRGARRAPVDAPRGAHPRLAALSTTSAGGALDDVSCSVSDRQPRFSPGGGATGRAGLRGLCARAWDGTGTGTGTAVVLASRSISNSATRTYGAACLYTSVLPRSWKTATTRYSTRRMTGIISAGYPGYPIGKVCVCVCLL